MAKPAQVSTRHAEIAKSNSRIILAAAIASALAMFTITGGHAILSRMSYQRRVINQQHQAINQLKDDISSLHTLASQYAVFNSANPNVLGVSNSGTTGDQGSNARIVLDALPSEYDFPALTSSIEKILAGRGLKPSNITGTDNSANAVVKPSGDPKPQPMDFTLSVQANYQNSQDLLKDFQRSIRPFKIITLDLTGSNSAMTLNLSMETYYQPSKILNITESVVK